MSNKHLTTLAVVLSCLALLVSIICKPRVAQQPSTTVEVKVAPAPEPPFPQKKKVTLADFDQQILARKSAGASEEEMEILYRLRQLIVDKWMFDEMMKKL